MSAPSPQLNLAFLLPPSWKEDIPRWYHEDTPSFDWAGLVVGDEQQEAILWAKSGGVLAGVPFFEEIFKHVDCTWVIASEQESSCPLTLSSESSVEWLYPEGQVLPDNSKTKVAIVRGKARSLLLGERVGLNMLARCSGIASM
jgi:nicotinate-nucleotide pyrophosphorylase (carboxylating)